MPSVCMAVRCTLRWQYQDGRLIARSWNSTFGAGFGMSLQCRLKMKQILTLPICGNGRQYNSSIDTRLCYWDTRLCYCAKREAAMPSEAAVAARLTSELPGHFQKHSLRQEYVHTFCNCRHFWKGQKALDGECKVDCFSSFHLSSSSPSQQLASNSVSAADYAK